MKKLASVMPTSFFHLCVNPFCADEFFRSIADVAHSSDLCHLILRFPGFCDFLRNGYQLANVAILLFTYLLRCVIIA